MREAWSVAVVLGVLSLNSQARATEQDATRRETRGLRANIGIMALGHAKRPSHVSSGSFAFVPGLSVELAYRLGAWEAEVGARGAYMTRSEEREIPGPPPRGGVVATFTETERTVFLAAGISARWYASEHSSQSLYLTSGVDFIDLHAADFAGIGPAFRAGVGIELWHDRPHHRLAFELVGTFPTFSLEGPSPFTFGSGAEAGEGRSSNAGAPLLYIVPLAAVARWTL